MSVEKTDGVVRRFEHYDLDDDLPRATVTSEGFLQAYGRLARTGVQEYKDSSGGTRRELRLPEDVKASVAGFALRPLTNAHPPQMLSPDNAKSFVAGAVGEATFDGQWVKAPVLIYAADAIAAARAGRAQLSVGYSCRLDAAAPVPALVEQYGHYDAIQREITANHVALVDQARAGAMARIRLDAGDAEVVLVRDTALVPPSNHMEKPMLKIVIDGLAVEVADAQSQSIIERAFVNAQKGVEAEKARADGLAQKLDAAVSAGTALQAKVDSIESAGKKSVKCDECDATGKLDEAKCDNCAGTGELKLDALADIELRRASRARSDARAASKGGASRAKLLVQAAEHLSANENLDSKSDFEIKKMILSKVDKDLKLDGKDAVYVDYRFDFEMEKLEKSKGKPIDRLRLIQGAVPAPVAAHADAENDALTAKERMQQNYSHQYYKNQK